MAAPVADQRASRTVLPVDVWVFLGLLVVMVPLHLPYVQHGMSFNDPSWYFHFGNRALQGDVPYRDYIFQVGPLPIYVDAFYQQVFGAKYVASLYAALTIKILRVFVIWMLVRRLASWQAAAALVVFCILDPLFSFAHHWSTGYAQLFMTLAALFILLATRSEGRKALLFLALGGFAASLVVSARQSAAIMIALMLFGTSAIMLVRKEYFTLQRFAALWGGFAFGFVCVFGALAIAGALGPAIQQMFLDAPQKKAVEGMDAVLDAISGGALVDWSHSWWGGFLTWLALPVALVGACVYVLAREDEREISLRTIAMVAVPATVLFGVLTRYATLNFISDVPRTFLTATTAIAVLAPDRMRRWFGVEPIAAVALGALPLASDWALEMSYPGRGWGDAPSLVVGALLLVLASTRLASRTKMWLCGVLATLSVLRFGVAVEADHNPFAKDEAADGTLAVNKHNPRVRGGRHPMLRGMRLPKARAVVVQWLTTVIPKGSTCFVYGNTPVLYDLVGCRNPTRLDTTAADFITAQDAENAVAILRANPPDFIIAHEKQWMSPPLNLDLGTQPYGGLNPNASRAMHLGLRSLLDQYEDVGYAADILGPDLAKQASGFWDVIDAVRLYRRKQ